ncbi:MAG: hypothetical protein ACMUFK_04825 [Thermoplasmatota archaeon]
MVIESNGGCERFAGTGRAHLIAFLPSEYPVVISGSCRSSAAPPQRPEEHLDITANKRRSTYRSERSA